MNNEAYLSDTPVLGVGAAYASGDAVGGGMCFPFLREALDRAGAAVNFTVTMQSTAVQPELELLLFDYDFTATADNAPFNPSAGDLANHCLGVVKIDAIEWCVYAANQIATVSIPVVLASGDTVGSVYAQLVTRTVFTPAAADEITVGFGLLFN